jgi:hypothetical protein
MSIWPQDGDLKKELQELARKIYDNPRDKNKLLLDWASKRPEDMEFRFLLFAIALERNEMSINITNSNVANLNLGEQIGHIESVVQTIASKGGEEDKKLAEALHALAEGVKDESQLSESDKKEAAQVLAEIAEQAEAQPEKRSSGKLKALLAGFPVMIAAAAHLTKLWEAWGPAIKAYFGL